MKQIIAPPITAVCLCALLLLWGRADKKYSRETAQQASISMAESLLGALSGSLQASLRRGRGSSDRINAILKNTIQSTRLQHILLLQNKTVLSQAGSLNPAPPQTGQGHRLDGSTLWLWRTLRLQDYTPNSTAPGTGYGRNRQEENEDLDLTNQQQLILLGLDATPLHQRILIERRRINTTIAVAFIAILILTASWIFILRNRELAQELERESLRAEHLSDLQLSGAGLAHETKNPLGLIRGLAQQLYNSDDASDNLRDITANIMEQADIATARLGEFLAFSKKHSPIIGPVNLFDTVDKVCHLMEYDANHNDITLTNKVQPELILADEQMLTQITVNLLTNALKACQAGDRIDLKSNRDETVSLTISDTGCGIPEKLQPEIFKPYVTGRTDGHGLGLAIVRRIADDHKWKIAIQSTETRGTRITITGLRRYQEEHA